MWDKITISNTRATFAYHSFYDNLRLHVPRRVSRGGGAWPPPLEIEKQKKKKKKKKGHQSKY